MENKGKFAQDLLTDWHAKKEGRPVGWGSALSVHTDTKGKCERATKQRRLLRGPTLRNHFIGVSYFLLTFSESVLGPTTLKTIPLWHHKERLLAARFFFKNVSGGCKLFSFISSLKKTLYEIASPKVCLIQELRMLNVRSFSPHSMAMVIWMWSNTGLPGLSAAVDHFVVDQSLFENLFW